MAEKLAEYRQQLAQVEAAIANDPQNVDWIKLRDDLIEVIELTSEIAETAESAGGSSAPGGAAVPLRKWAVGERCQAIFEQDGQWYNAKIVALAEDGYFVTYLGFGNTAQVRQPQRQARR
jgi:survival-of-motor-neuron-related-splicing factor 30